jgi:hypothetical protein
MIKSGQLANGKLVGQKVAVTGVYREMFDVSTVTAARVDVLDATQTPMIPLALSPQALADVAGGEAYESVLVKLDGAGPFTITDDAPDGTGKFFEFVVNGALRVDDTIWEKYGTTGTAYPPAGFTKDTAFSALTGIMYYSFGARKLCPRGPEDVFRPAP